METDDLGGRQNEEIEEFGDDKLKAAFESYKSKQYALSVPLRVVALRGSVPPSWVKVRLLSTPFPHWERINKMPFISFLSSKIYYGVYKDK